MVQYDICNDCWKWLLLPTFKVWQVYQERIYKYFPKWVCHNLGRVKLKYNKGYVILVMVGLYSI